MKLSKLFLPTLRETPSDAEVISHKLLLRAGYIRKLAAGIYTFLPMGVRAMRNVEQIVREEMDRSGALEVLMPSVQPASVWKESGRWQFYGSELLRFTDRKGGNFCLGPTHEEVVTDMVRGEVRSYRELPLNLYQIQTKFRDELRPRAGLMRGREFIMKDAYSFDVDVDASKEMYQVMFDTYCRIFDRCGLRYRPVEADTGAIGGNLSHEFQVLADSGEDSIVSCDTCGYTANVEKAELRALPQTFSELAQAAGADLDAAYTRVDTPGTRTVEQVAEHLGVPTTSVIKTLVFIADDEPVAVLMRGDLDVNEIKVKAALGVDQLHMARDKQVEKYTGAPVGFVGPVGLEGVRILADESVRGARGAVVGAREVDAHFVGVDLERDAGEMGFADLRLAGAGDACGRCGEGTFEFFRGIEVGQVFHLGTKYAEPMGCTFLDENGEEKPMVMGCYGIGVTRILSAAIEQNHDKDGIVWPMALAPYQVIVLPMRLDDPDVMAFAERVYDGLLEAGVDVLFDDRDNKPGVKFKDADLIGVPLRVTIGPRGVKSGEVEIRRRGSDQNDLVPIDDAVANLRARIAAELAS